MFEAYTCPYCGSPAEICDSSRVYVGRSYGRILVCTRYPACDSYVGCHIKSNLPKGTMADAELRSLRREAHKLFDRSWESRRLSRSAAYKWLAKQLKMAPKDAHIGLFNGDTCRQVIAMCNRLSSV